MNNLYFSLAIFYLTLFAIGAYAWTLYNIDHRYTLPIASLLAMTFYIRGIQITNYANLRTQDYPELTYRTEWLGGLGVVVGTIVGFILSINAIIYFIEGGLSNKTITLMLSLVHLCSILSPTMLLTHVPLYTPKPIAICPNNRSRSRVR